MNSRESSRDCDRLRLNSCEFPKTRPVSAADLNGGRAEISQSESQSFTYVKPSMNLGVNSENPFPDRGATTDMNVLEFLHADARLTQRQREVLLEFLPGDKDDIAIAADLYVTEQTVRKHLSDICKTFCWETDDGEEKAVRRAQLVSLYAKYRPELFSGVPFSPTSCQKIVLSYHQSAPLESDIALALYRAFSQREYEVLLADANLRMTATGRRQIQTGLSQCDRLVVLLSQSPGVQSSASSEMVTEEVALARNLFAQRASPKPSLVAAYLNCPPSLLGHKLRGYLEEARSIVWKSPKDTDGLVRKILDDFPEEGEPSTITLSEASESFSDAAVPVYPPKIDAEPQLPRGQVELASAFYVERPGVEDRCYEEIVQPGALIRVKAPRQMGKTSLMARILHEASRHDYETVQLTFQFAECDIFSSLDRFLQWVCAIVTLRLKLPLEIDRYWQGSEILGSKIVCTRYMEDYLLPEIDRPLVLGLDEVDILFDYPQLTTDFFGLLRAWHEESKNNPLWQRLRLVIVHSTEAYVPMPVNQSPFNVGLPIALPEFTPEMVADLASRHGLHWGDDEVTRLMHCIGGHPYLVRLALYYIARGEFDLPTLLKIAPTDSGIYGDHLRRHLWVLEQHDDLATAFKAVIHSETPVELDSMQGFKLYSMGLANLPGNHVTLRYNLYRKYFQSRL
ncbi:AAA-like domain-containing protein [Baaleninema sp.]|uniref:AAA-like domain-containing protein n=1 Tax=Baaleninema sp. TaxID=3101197 RepID=UPI003D04C3E6